jgi:hypothetical protein
MPSHPTTHPSIPHGALLVVGYLYVCDHKHNTMFIHISLSSKFFMCYALYWWMSSENGGKVDIIVGKFLDFSRFKPKSLEWRLDKRFQVFLEILLELN